MEDSLTKLHAQRAAITKRIRQEKRKVTQHVRKEETRTKIIIGALAQTHMEANPDSDFSKTLLRLMDEYVTKPKERALLGLSNQPANDLKSKFADKKNQQD